MMFSRFSAVAKAGRLAAVLGMGALGLGMTSLVLAPVAALAQGAGGGAAAQQIADHFSSVRTMTGEFVQFGPKGEQTGGKFFLQRPGRIRFNYDGSSNFQVVSDGKSVILENPRMKTVDLYSLGQTPLKLLLDERIDLSGGKVQSIQEESDLTTIKLADKSVFGNSTITMMFDPASYELKQWTITDAQGKDTTVMIFNVQQGVTIDPRTFNINYNRVRTLNQAKSRR